MTWHNQNKHLLFSVERFFVMEIELWKKREETNPSNLHQELNLRLFTNQANALPTELQRQIYRNVSQANSSSLWKMLNHCFLQTLLQSLDPTPDGFPTNLDRAVASQKVRWNWVRNLNKGYLWTYHTWKHNAASPERRKCSKWKNQSCNGYTAETSRRDLKITEELMGPQSLAVVAFKKLVQPT